MAGIRIQHPTERSVTFTIADQRRPYRGGPLACSVSIYVAGQLAPCARTHTFKTYHLNLDETGAVIVSETIWERVGPQFSAAGFRVANAVENPPDQTIHVPRLILRQRALAPGAVDAEVI